MRGEYFRDLLLASECSLDVFGRSEVSHPALPLRERLVGNVADEVLQEAVLAVLRRRGIGLHAEDLLPRERPEKRVELRFVETSDGGEHRGA